MENQEDREEADLPPGRSSSSSSSSPPSSPSSSVSSSSSPPSQAQSFASSRSSQKELLAPSSSSSASTSTSSSPFSRPSSPAPATSDPAGPSAMAESSSRASFDNMPHQSNGVPTFPNSSLPEGPPADLHLNVSARLDFQDADSHARVDVCSGRAQSAAALSTDFDGWLGSELSDGHLLSMVPQDYDDQANTSGAPCTEQRTGGGLVVEESQGVEQGNGCKSLSGGMQFPTPAFANNAREMEQAPVDINVGRCIDVANGSYSRHETVGLETGSETGFSHEVEIDLKQEKSMQNSDHTCTILQADSYFESTPVPEVLASVRNPLGPTGTLSACYETHPENDEGRTSSPDTTDKKSSQNSKDVPSDRSGLPRAKTMPSGSLKVINGEVQPSRHQNFKRSSTVKSKADRDNLARTPRNKLLKRKQKKLMKKMCTMQKDGTVELDMERSARFTPDFFVSDDLEDSSSGGDEDDRKAIPSLQIAILIVGTRGDVQPFVAIGKHLQEYGHRVRLATHSNFQEFVLKAGLEFYPLGGDPKVLAGYMVKNKGFLPSGPSEIKTQKKELKSIIYSLLPACTLPYGGGVPFKAQAIIANPPAYGHVHVAERLNVPLHIFFTMPWTPTSEFAHPLSRVGHFAANRLSYQVVDSLIWLGMRGMINNFRKKKLGLRPITYLSGSQLSMSKLPTGYIWSPQLVPKPKDWGSKIDVVGFCFLNLSQDYNPSTQLVEWLAAGPAPIYVGFGSLPVEDPKGMTEIILRALKETCQRGIIDKGWGGIGTMVELPDTVYLLDNCPHDWLFSQCAAVVHHGGAGTTAAGLRAGCPTTIVPFFGDQGFWGERVHARGVGPAPIPVEHFSLEKLVNAIHCMMDKEVKERAVDLAKAMEAEDGVEGAVKAFHKHLPKEMPQPISHVPSQSRWSGPWLSLLRSCFQPHHHV